MHAVEAKMHSHLTHRLFECVRECVCVYAQIAKAGQTEMFNNRNSR